MTILLVDDDRELCDLLQFAFRRAGLTSVVAYDAPGAQKLLDAEHPELIVLDLNLGAWNGLDLLQEIRRTSTTRVIILTARDAEEDKIRGLELGADDYVTKPFSHRELIARVRAHMRRMGDNVPEAEAGPRQLAVGPLEMNVDEHWVKLNGKELRLTVTEFRLLNALMRQAGSVVPTRQLLRKVWGHEDSSGSEVVRVTVHRLRAKLQDDASEPHLLHTVAGVGVMLKPTTAGDPPLPEP